MFWLFFQRRFPDHISCITLIPSPYKVRDLGLHCFSMLNFSENILIQVAKSRKPIGLAQRIFETLESRLLMHKIHVKPILDYCYIVCSNIRPINRLQFDNFHLTFTKGPPIYSLKLIPVESLTKPQLDPFY